MKSILSICFFLAVIQFCYSAQTGSDSTKTVVCGTFSPINVTAVELAGEWYVKGYNYDGKNDRSSLLNCLKLKFIVNADGLTGLIEVTLRDHENKSRTHTTPFMVSKPGVLVIAPSADNDRTKTLTVLHLDGNVLAYHFITSNCGTGKETNETRVAVRNVERTRSSDLEMIMRGIDKGPHGEPKEFREVTHSQCQTTK